MRPRVLIVEDNDSLRGILKEQLGFLGMNVFDARDCESAKELLETSNPMDIIISDLNMPGGNGLDLFHWIRQNLDNKSKKAALILMTGFAEEFDSNRARDLNVEGFLAKPFDGHLLKHMVDSLLEPEPLGKAA